MFLALNISNDPGIFNRGAIETVLHKKKDLTYATISSNLKVLTALSWVEFKVQQDGDAGPPEAKCVKIEEVNHLDGRQDTMVQVQKNDQT